MICPNCKIEMTKGSLAAHGQFWGPTYTDRSSFWQPFGIGSKMKPLIAWKCETCNKVELSTEATTSPTRG